MKKIILLFICMFIICGCEDVKNPIVTMEIEDYGTIKFELYPQYAPNTVANFVNLVEDGFYDNNTIHRVVPEFVIQGGDPDGTGLGGPDYNIFGEYTENGFRKNTLSHTTGIVSMARANNPDSAGSQFFIVLSDKYTSVLDGKYAAFGEVIDKESMKVINKLAEEAIIEDEESGKLKNSLTIKKTTVETFGKTYKVKKIS